MIGYSENMIMDIFYEIIHLFFYYLLQSPAHSNYNHCHIAALTIRTPQKHKSISDIYYIPDTNARLGIDSHVDISCAGNHTHIIEVIEGKPTRCT